ncbi:MAG: hypothetical protein K2L52_02340 [Clostridia bacterium]|nr:hypothetical protein [Clostridia bacterium]
MKKKIVALILMLALVSTFFVGCSLFETDANRDYHQVVANVSYTTKDSGTLTAVVYKGEVKTQVNYYGAYYLQYWTAEQVVEYCFNSVARQKLLLLYAQEYLYVNKLIPDGFGFDSLGAWNTFKNKSDSNLIEAYAKFLTIDEMRYCIESVNKQFNESWQELIEEREDEVSKNESSSDDNTTDDEDTDEDDEDELLSARDQKDRTADEDEDDEYELNESIKSVADVVKYFAEKYEVTLDESKLSNAYFYNYVNSLIRKENNDKQKIMKTALNELKKNIEDQFMSYEYFLVQQMQSQIISKYTDNVGTLQEVIDQVKEDYENRYNTLVADAIKAYNDSDNSAYNTAVGEKTFAYATPSKDYLQVKSILLSFSDAQKNAITALASLSSSNEEISKIVRNAFATGVVPKGYEGLSLEVFADLGIKVNVSNPDYDAEEDKLKDAYTDASIEGKDDVYANPAVNYLTVIIAMANDIQSKVNKALDWAKANNMSEVEQYLVKQHASQEAFNDWINLVNDDGGMVSSDVYAVTPDGKSTSYVEEYTVLARNLKDAGVGAMAIKDYKKDETLDSGTASYEGTTEILKSANGTYTIYKQEMTSSVGEFEEDLKAEVYTLVTENGAELSFIVNEFGIHIVMVAGLPVDEKLGTLSTQTAPDPDDKDKEKTFYVKNDDYLYEYSVKIEYVKDKDEDGNEIVTDEIETVTVEKKSIKEYLEELLNDELSTNVTRLQQLNLFSDESYISKVDKVYKQIVKELKESIKG